LIAIDTSQWPPLCEDGADRLEQFAFQYGQNYDSYLVTEPGWEHFWSRDRRGAVAMVRSGRNIFVSGGLLTPDDHKESLLAELVEYTDQQRLVPVFFNIVESNLPLFRRFQFQATKWGEEALVDLDQCKWSGRGYEWVRRQSNYCRRHGLVFEECRPQATSPDGWEETLAELSEISKCFLASKPQTAEILLLESNFDPRQVGRKRIFAVRADHGRGRIEGFLACNPSRNGAMWAMETYRQRTDAVRGTIPFLIHQAMLTLQSEGVKIASLCLVPGLRCGESLPGDSRLVRWGILFGTRYCRPIFNAAGIYHFKSAFRPHFENRYLCARPRMTLGTAWAFIRLLGVLRLDFVKMTRQFLRRRKGASVGEHPYRAVSTERVFDAASGERTTSPLPS
jgi:phosphatidylglycerol lysyltransferase